MKIIKAGYVSIVGRPNVGKSTLLNNLVQQKISITSSKRQTTRHNILGIKTLEKAQIVFVDTPGIHLGEDSAINRYMNRTASSATGDVDAIIFVVEKNNWNKEDEGVLQLLLSVKCPVIIAINKADQLNNQHELLPWVSELSKKIPSAEIVPVSALKKNKPGIIGKYCIG